MIAWWCEQPAHREGAVCTRRAFAERLKTLKGESKKAALREHHAEPASATAHKAMTDEAKAMLKSFCATPQGAPMQLCQKSLSILEMSKRLWRLQHRANASGRAAAST